MYRRVKWATVAVLAVILLVHFIRDAQGAYFNSRFDTISVFYSGQADAQVVCGENDADWRAIVTQAYGHYVAVDGFSYPGTSNHHVYMNPWVCEALQRSPEYREYGAALETLIHESYHLRYGADEHVVECHALSTLSSALVKWAFPKLDTSMLGAALQGPAYYAAAYSARRGGEYAGCSL